MNISIKNPYFRALAVVVATLSLLACVGQEPTKVVTKHHKNGTDGSCGNNCPSKPTEETGDHAAAYAALSLISLKQTAQYFDLAINSNSPHLDRCQTATTKKENDKTDLLTIAIDPKKCFFNRTTRWSGLIEIEITYANEKRGAEAQIEKITKRSFVPTKIDFKRGKTNQSIILNDAVTFTKQIDKSFLFEYRASLSLETSTRVDDKPTQNNVSTKTNSKNPKPDRVVTSESLLEASGRVRPELQEWQITKSELTNERSGFRIQETNVQFAIGQSDPDLFSTLTCGVPMGYLSAHQEITIGKSPIQIYNPNLKVDSDGLISVINGASKYRLKPCNFGINDLNETIVKADLDIGRR